jgi:hypothetical protein
VRVGGLVVAGCFVTMLQGFYMVDTYPWLGRKLKA